jgi:hypothetical protein
VQKANFGGTARGVAGSFSIGNKGYIGLGYDSSGGTSDFWEYAPDTLTSINKNKINSSISIFPNPFSSSTTLNITDNFSNVTLTIYNTLGQEIKSIKNISTQTIILGRDNLENGIYFIHLTQDNKIVATEKIIITD